MATYDLTTVPNKSYQIYEANSYKVRKHVFDIAVDMATQNANDIAKVIPIYAGEFVANVFLRVVTASTTGSSTVSVGDSGSGTAWFPTGQAVTSTGVFSATGANVFTQSGSVPYAVTWVGGKYYSAADYVSVTLGSTAPANGQLEIIAEITQILATTAV